MWIVYTLAGIGAIATFAIVVGLYCLWDEHQEEQKNIAKNKAEHLERLFKRVDVLEKQRFSIDKSLNTLAMHFAHTKKGKK